MTSFVCLLCCFRASVNFSYKPIIILLLLSYYTMEGYKMTNDLYEKESGPSIRTTKDPNRPKQTPRTKEKNMGIMKALSKIIEPKIYPAKG